MKQIVNRMKKQYNTVFIRISHSATAAAVAVYVSDQSVCICWLQMSSQAVNWLLNTQDRM